MAAGSPNLICFPLKGLYFLSFPIFYNSLYYCAKRPCCPWQHRHLAQKVSGKLAFHGAFMCKAPPSQSDGNLLALWIAKWGNSESNTPQQATGHDLACSFGPKGRGIWPSRHSPNIRASAAAWLIARGNKLLFIQTSNQMVHHIIKSFHMPMREGILVLNIHN